MASIGVPAEIKRDEQRVALTPDAVRELVGQGMDVRIQAGAGLGAGFIDDQFGAAGGRLVNAEEAWAAHLVVKVKEPLASEIPLLKKGQILFTYLHLAANRALTEGLLASGATCIAYETVEVNHRLPLPPSTSSVEPLDT